MNKVPDLKYVLGAVFTIVGLLLISYAGRIAGEWNLNKAIGWGNGYSFINRWAGISLMVLGVILLLLSFRKGADDKLKRK